MTNLESLFKQSTNRAEEELKLIDLEKIHELGISKTHKDLLGSHTVVTYPPLDALEKVDGEELFDKLNFNEEVDAYVHIPFCEYPCKFCPYTTLSLNKEGVNKFGYLDALQKEIKTWSRKLEEHNSQISSVYFGGGTPFALPQNQLENLITFLYKTLPFVEDPDICIEASPRAMMQESTLDKLAMLQTQGVNRVSIGVQSFDFESLRDMARTFKGHATTDEESAVKILMDSGISNINVDMIQDLPLKSNNYIDRLKHDLFKIALLKPHHLTWYSMRLRPETIYAQKEIRVVTEQESLRTRLIIWNFMEQIGYKILEGDRFVLDEMYEDRFRKTRGSVETDLLGIGVSAYSHINSAFFQNPRLIKDSIRQASKEATHSYIEAVHKNGHAISYGFHISKDEFIAGKFVLGLKRGVNYNELMKEYSSKAECQPYLDFALESSKKILDAELIEISEDGIMQFTQKGRLFENEICALFYSPTVRYLAHKRRTSLTTEIESEFRVYKQKVLSSKSQQKNISLNC